MTSPDRATWLDNCSHLRWLEGQTDALLNFYKASVDQGGGYYWLGLNGDPRPELGKQLWLNPRFVYAFTLGHLLGDPGYARLVRDGIRYLESGPLRDEEYGGWFWAIEMNGERMVSKKAYGHAFVLLAAATAVFAGFEAHALLESALDVLLTKFWDEEHGMFVDSWDREFKHLDTFRGQNVNMHLVEALMAAAEVTGDKSLLGKAIRIAERLIRDTASTNEWRVPEAFDENWRVDRSRPVGNADWRGWGSVPGHGLEWSRLLLQLKQATGNALPWAEDAARQLFDRAILDGWDNEIGGFRTLVDLDGLPANEDRPHWPIAEGIGAAVALHRVDGDKKYARWYQTFWEFAGEHLIEPATGSWRHQLNPKNSPSSTTWDGKPDVYHAVHATLFARTADAGSIASNLLRGQRSYPS